MRRPWIKVCGITRPEDARAAVEAGAHALGFILHEASPRRVDPDVARGITRDLPEGIARVGVTVSQTPDTVRAWVEDLGLTAIQAHGNETPETCRAYGVPVVKALRASPGKRPADFGMWRGMPVLLDAYHPDLLGGTGRTADWALAAALREDGFRLLLAGGLGPGTVGEAVGRVHPLGIDLNSAVEIAPGIKDPRALRLAISEIPGEDPPDKETWPW